MCPTASSPAEIGYYETLGSARAIAIGDSYGYVTTETPGSLRIVDISDPAQPTQVGFYTTSGSVYGAAVAGDYAYLADVASGLRVVSITDPKAPTETGFYEIPGPVYGVAVADNYAYVAAGERGLRIIDVSDPARPTEVGYYDVGGHTLGIAVAGTHAYVAHSSGLRILDVSSPASPSEVGYQGTPTSARRVEVADEYAYVVAGSSGLHLFDVSDPENPTRVGGYDTPGHAAGVAVSGVYAYVADWDQGVRILDVSAPASPIEVSFYDAPGHAKGVAVAGNYVYVAGGIGGLWILRTEKSGRPPVALSAPSLEGPASGADLPSLGTPLSWQLPSGAAQYHLQVTPFDNDGPSINFVRSAAASYTIPTPVLGQGPYVMLPGMTYSWRIRATDKAAPTSQDDPTWGAWSDTWTFTTPAPVSETVRFTSPVDGATLLSTAPAGLRWNDTDTAIFYYEVKVSRDPSFNTAPAGLRWNDTNTAIFYYEVKVSRDPSFNTGPATAISFVWQNTVHGGLTDPLNSWKTPTLEANATYYWRVRPRVQGDGAPVAWSRTASFRSPAAE